MNLNQIELKKTAILFFDILNGYYHSASEANKARKKPMVEGAVRVMKAGRQAGIPIFFAKGNNRANGCTSGDILTDTKIDLTPWPNGVATKQHVRLNKAPRKTSSQICDNRNFLECK